jgi:phosphonate transport system ATP-binding protein
VIELLGVGIASRDRWLLHRVCAHIYQGAVIAVCSRDPAERAALLAAVTGRTIPDEGRVWVSRVPVAKGFVRRLRAHVVEVDPGARFEPHRSALWNTLADGSGLGGLKKLWRFHRARDRGAALRSLARVGLDARSSEPVDCFDPLARVRLAVARALWRGPEYLVVHDPDAALDAPDLAELLALLRELVRAERLGVLVSGAAAELLLAGADRVLLLSEGRLIFDGAPADVTGSGVPVAGAQVI